MNLNRGIYQIRNIITEQCYIGQSVNLKQRKSTHWRDLKNNNGKENIFFQRSYNRYGKSKFIFEILMYCSKENLTKYEQLFDSICMENNLSYNVRDPINNYQKRKWTKERRVNFEIQQKKEKYRKC